MNQTRWKLVAILGSFSLSVCALVVILGTSTVYERTLYAAYPSVFWACFLLTIASGLLLIFHSATVGDGLWKHGIALIAATYFVFAVLPMDMGLPFWTTPLADTFLHFSYTDFIVRTGGIPASDSYPQMHIYMAELVLFTGLPVETFQLLGYLSTMLFIIGAGLYGRQLFGSRRGALFTLGAATPLLYSKFTMTAVPWFVSFALIPITLVLIDRYSRSSYRVRRPTANGVAFCGLLLIATVTFYHYMTGLVLFGVLVTAALAVRVRNHLFSGPNWSMYQPEWAAIVLCVLYLRYFSNEAFKNKLSDVLASLLVAEPGTARQAGQAGESGYTVLQLVTRFLIGEYGPAILYVAVGGVLVSIILYRSYRTGASVEEVLLAGLFGSGLLLAIVLLGINLGADGVYRINQLTLFAAVLLIGWGLCTLSKRSVTIHGVDPSMLRYLLVVCVVLTAVIVPFTVFPGKEYQTEETFDGAEWFVGHWNTSIETRERGLTTKTTRYVVGERRYEALENEPFGDLDGNALPRHLGYTENASATRTLGGEPTYLITTIQDLEWWKTEPTNRYPHIDHYNKRDLQELRRDRAANRVYSNGEFAVWLANR